MQGDMYMRKRPTGRIKSKASRLWDGPREFVQQIASISALGELKVNSGKSIFPISFQENSQQTFTMWETQTATYS